MFIERTRPENRPRPIGRNRPSRTGRQPVVMTQDRTRANTKRLAVFAPSMARGGAERGALKLAEGLVHRGFEVDLVLASAEGPRLAEIPDEVRLVDLRAGRVLTSLPGLTRYLRDARPLGMASVLDHANVVALWAARLARFQGRVVVIEQNTLLEAARNGKSRRDRMMPRLVRRFYPWADYVVGVSEGVTRDLVGLAELPPEKVRVVYNPIVTPDIRERAGASVDHAWFSDESHVFVAAGRLRPQKDFRTLLRAFAALRARRSARLLILGDGPERADLEHLTRELDLESDVSLPGAVDNPYAYFSRATAFVLSSRWEGLPTVLIEALACGAPVIATDCPSGPREILAGGRYGRLVPVGDAGLMAEAMEAVLDGKVSAPPAESWRPYELDTVVDGYLALLAGGTETDSTASAAG